MLNSGNTSNMGSLSLVNLIMWLVKRNGEVKVTHTYREANYYAEALAKYGATSGEDMRFK